MRQMLRCVALLAIAPSAHAGATVWIAGTGNWNTPGNWSGGDVPDMLGDVAVIPLDTAVVNLNISPTIDGVAITTAGARLNLGGFTLNVSPQGLDTTGLLVANAGSSVLIGNLSNTGAGAGRGIEVTAGATLNLSSSIITNSGRIEINPTNAGLQTTLHFSASSDLGGTGELILGSPANRAILATGVGATITQAAAHTIRGMGQVPAALINNGLVSADVAGNVLTLQTNPKTNNGTLEGTNASFLDITGITITQGIGGLILGDGGTVRLSSVAIDGGSTNTLNFGVVQFTGGSNTLNSITSLGDLDQLAGTTVLVTGNGLTNDGVYDVNPTNAGVQTVLQFNDSGDLDGTGQLVMGGFANRSILATGAGVTITQATTHTIRGLGQINASLINNGLVSADVAGNVLTLQTNSKTNNSLMQATNASFLDITGITITQTPFSIIAADAATLRLSSATIDQGTLQSLNGGQISLISGVNTLDSVSLVGPASATGGTTTVVKGPGLNILDTFEINPINAGVVTILHFDDIGSLTGGGTLLMSGIVNRSQLNASPGVTVTNDPSNIIRGVGQINAPLVNNGVVSADVAGNVLTLQTSPKTNNNLMQAVNGAFLDITSITVTQTPFSAVTADASTIRLSSSHIDQGTLQTLNGGLVNLTSGVSTLTSVVLAGTAEAVGGTATVINGTGLVNQGTLTINPPNGGVVTVLRFDEEGSLSGSGQLILSGIVNRSQLNTAAGVTLTHEAGHTIRGVGQINAAMINNGVVQSDVLGNVLTLQTSPKTNNNVIQAINGAFLDITSITVTQDTFAEIIADASTIRLNSAAISNGTLRAINGGITQALTGTNTLNDLTNLSPIDQTGGTVLQVTGAGLNNHATIRVNPPNAGVVTTFTFPAGGFLDGSGSLLLAGSTNRAILTATTGTITQGIGHTIGGIGQINAPLLINNGSIAPGLSAGTLAINGVVTQGGAGILDFELGGTAAGQFDVLAGTGTLNLGGTLRARFIDGHFPAGAATYAIITTTNRPGRFASFDLPALDAGRSWSVEYLPAAVRLRAGPFCFGDATFDNIVNFADVTSVLANFGTNYSPAPGTGPGDSTRDGIVNFADITSTLANFNATCP